jgi:two-component system, cell cycle response regulator DivK
MLANFRQVVASMDGYAATRRIKADPALRSIPIIAVTSYALNGEEKIAKAAGCDDYVPKPYSPRELAARAIAPLAGEDHFRAQG